MFVGWQPKRLEMYCREGQGPPQAVAQFGKLSKDNNQKRGQEHLTDAGFTFFI